MKFFFILNNKFVLMTDNCNYLISLLNTNPKLRDEFNQYFPGDSQYRIFLENLLLDLKPSQGENLIKKISDTNNLNKFYALVSELITARILTKNEGTVSLLPDDYFKKKRSPDILYKKDDLSIYFEVTHFSDSSVVLEIIADLKKILHNHPIVVTVNIQESLSAPCYSHKDRENQRSKAATSIHQFEECLNTFTPGTYPKEIQTNDINFLIAPADKKPGYPGFFISGGIISSSPFIEYVSFRLVDKALKRTDFQGEHRNYPYIIVFMSDDPSIDEIDFDDLLYGLRRTYGIIEFGDPELQKQLVAKREGDWSNLLTNKETIIPQWSEISNVASKTWNDFLIKKHLIPAEYTYLEKAGLFLTNPSMKNVSGVLLIKKTLKYHFFPNPFCDYEINNSKIEKLLC